MYFNTRRVFLLFIVITILSLFAFPINAVQAATNYTQTIKTGIENFPETYRTALQQLKKLHPNWNFEAYYTGIKWDNVVLNETATHGRNRVIKSSDASWKCSCGNIASGYACASSGIVKYYLDPRNFLNEVNIFQFLEISYNPNIHNVDGIKSVIKNTFMDKEVTYTVLEKENNEEGIEETVEKEYTKHYAEIILEAAKASNMSPYSIAIKIIQEVGTKGSNSVSGTYEGYKGYYNFYNLGAYDTGNAIVNALKYARDKQWNNQYKAIIEGAQELANSYTNAGQNTAYFYKWDVVGTKILKVGNTQTVSSSNMFWHQYMTNVQDPTSQSKTLYNTYAKNKILDESLNFIIPVYENMPDENSSMPTGLTTEDGDLYYVNCTDGLAVRNKPTTSGTKLTSLSKNTVVVVLERECATANNYQWDKIKLANGLTGYAASKYLTLKSASTNSEVTGGTTNPPSDTPVDTSDNNAPSETPANTLSGNEFYKIEEKNMVIVPGTTLDKIDSSATGELKTGGKIKVNGKEYTAVVLGDTNGDGNASAGDYVLIKNHIMQTNVLKDEYKKMAADVNGDQKISAADYVLIKNYIMKGTNFSL